MAQHKLTPLPAQPIFAPFEDDGPRPPASNREVERRVTIANGLLASMPHITDAATCECEVIGA